MLVRVNYSKLERLVYFDDSTHKTTRNLQFEEWGEFLVVWRKDSLELYSDHVSSSQMMSLHFKNSWLHFWRFSVRQAKNGQLNAKILPMSFHSSPQRRGFHYTHSLT